MNNIFKEFSGYLSFTAAFISLLLTGVSLLRIWKDKKSSIEATQEKSFEDALAANNINKLGKYFEDVLGKLTIYQYSSNTTITHRIDQYLNRIQDYLGSEDQVIQQQASETNLRKDETINLVPDDFKSIISELQTGEPWNALARLRRHIEITLCSYAKTVGIKSNKPYSTNQLLEFLINEEHIDPIIASNLKFAISISNKAIHGYDITYEQAKQAILHTIQALNQLPLKTN